jgi:hypothetical protein
MVSFGVFYGVSSVVVTTLAMARLHRKSSDVSGVPGVPRSFWVSLSVPYGILVLFFLTLRFTPVHMRWVPLLIAYVVSVLIMSAIFDAAKAGRFRSRRNEKEQLQAK